MFINFFIINLVIIGLFIFSYYFLYKKNTKNNANLLNLRKESKNMLTKKQDVKNNFNKNDRNLTIYFNFSGKSFNAYEILGLVSGAPFSEVKQAYFKKKIHSTNIKLIEEAFKAIRIETNKK